MRRFLFLIVGLPLLASCASAVTSLPQFSDRYIAYTVIEQDQEARLLGINTQGEQILHRGTPGSIWFKPDTRRLFFVKDNTLYQHGIGEGGSTRLYTPSFPDIRIDQVIVRGDEQYFAVLLVSDTKHFDTMRPCRQNKFCIMEVGSLQEDSTVLVDLPPAFQYGFLSGWEGNRTYPYIEYQREATRAEYAYAEFDDEGSGLFSLVVKQLGDVLPVVEYYSNDLRLEVFTLPAVEERSPEGWRVFYFRSAEQIYHRFPEEYIIPRMVEVVPSPNLKYIAYRIAEQLFIFSMDDRTFSFGAEATNLLRWTSADELVYTHLYEDHRINVRTGEISDPGRVESCGGLQLHRQYGVGEEILTVAVAESQQSWQIPTTAISAVICNVK